MRAPAGPGDRGHRHAGHGRLRLRPPVARGAGSGRYSRDLLHGHLPGGGGAQTGRERRRLLRSHQAGGARSDPADGGRSARAQAPRVALSPPAGPAGRSAAPADGRPLQQTGRRDPAPHRDDRVRAAARRRTRPGPPAPARLQRGAQNHRGALRGHRRGGRGRAHHLPGLSQRRRRGGGRERCPDRAGGRRSDRADRCRAPSPTRARSAALPGSGLLRLAAGPG